MISLSWCGWSFIRKKCLESDIIIIWTTEITFQVKHGPSFQASFHFSTPNYVQKQM